MSRRRSVLVTFAVAALAALAAGAPAQAASFKYPRCKIVASGTIEVSAFLASPLLMDSDFRTDDQQASYAITSSASYNVNGIDDSFAEVFRQALGDGCVTDIHSAVAGQTTYSLTGSTTTMNSALNTITIQDASIARQNPGAAGLPVTAANSYTIPQDLQTLILIPFTVNAAGTVTVTTFDFFRQDTTSTTGFMVGAFQIWADQNANCQIDSGEPAIEGGAGIVFPNGTYSEPPRQFAIAAGSYVLALSYFNDIDLTLFSQDCTTSPSAGGHMVDGFTLRLDVQ
jgi:hypothetical protein